MDTPQIAVQAAVRLLPGQDKRMRRGMPWAYSNEITMDAAARAVPPGSLVRLAATDGAPLGVASFNPHCLIAARMFDRDPAARIDTAFFVRRLERALSLRERLFGAPFYRLAHSDADALPGLVVDRYGDAIAVQLNTAGSARLESEILAALDQVLRPSRVCIRNDSPARALEGLPSEVRFTKGEGDAPVEIVENGLRYLADIGTGQKTGWFFDQRENRAFAAGLARNARVLDLYCYTGGFAIAAAAAGATEVVACDRSEPALALAARAAALNDAGARIRFERSESFAAIAALEGTDERFDLVIADPPAFVKSRKDLEAGARGYRKLVRGAARRVRAPGFLCVASCSHNLDLERFLTEIARGLADANRSGRILRISGAGSDHPIHPFLPQTAYLKFVALALD
jgi:23S rRNA (cytosine1962-C5)-methyltransferase